MLILSTTSEDALHLVGKSVGRLGLGLASNVGQVAGSSRLYQSRGQVHLRRRTLDTLRWSTVELIVVVGASEGRLSRSGDHIQKLV